MLSLQGGEIYTTLVAQSQLTASSAHSNRQSSFADVGTGEMRVPPADTHHTSSGEKKAVASLHMYVANFREHYPDGRAFAQSPKDYCNHSHRTFCLRLKNNRFFPLSHSFLLVRPRSLTPFMSPFRRTPPSLCENRRFLLDDVKPFVAGAGFPDTRKKARGAATVATTNGGCTAHQITLNRVDGSVCLLCRPFTCAASLSQWDTSSVPVRGSGGGIGVVGGGRSVRRGEAWDRNIYTSYIHI